MRTWTELTALAEKKGKQYVCERFPGREHNVEITNNNTGTTGMYKNIQEAYWELYHDLL